jgi:hypothetical protein
MKTKLHHYFILSFILALILALATPRVNAQTLIQYWDFNATPPVGGGGGDSLGNVTNPLAANQVAIGLTAGQIIYSRPQIMYNQTELDGILDNGSQGSGIYDYSNSNDTGSSAAGNLFVRTRNPSDSSEMYFYIPTTGYKNIQFDFALSASSTKGPNYGIFSYSTNGGTSWNNLNTAMDTFNIGGTYRPDTLQLQNPVTSASAWYPVQINFTSDANVNNNANFIVKMMLAGPNSHQQTSGNARFDNFSVWGTSVAGINELPAQVAGYNVYPNPAQNIVYIISDKYTDAKIITLFNVVGQPINTIENKDKQSAIDISALTSGIYFVEIKEVNTGNKYTVKIAKE